VTAELSARGIAENSRAAVVAALEAGAHYVESDCHLTRDGVVVLFHDEDLRRVTGDARAVAEVSYAELFELMAPRGGLLTLEQLLEDFSATRFNIGVKSDAVAEPAGRIIGLHSDRVLLASFDDARRQRALAAAHAVRGVLPATSPGKSRLMRLLLAGVLRSPRHAAIALANVDAVQIPERHRGVRVLSQRLIDTVHAHGIEVHVWTVNDPVRMQQLVALGVDGIITDRADVALRVLG
ncbi:MAG: glycerophosphodiester phosphodiesterase, partial [Leucobacter sp.]|nr:glycerophosphodiester phosphodiesterase [Leucobacter sp.]